MTFLKL